MEFGLEKPSDFGNENCRYIYHLAGGPLYGYAALGVDYAHCFYPWWRNQGGGCWNALTHWPSLTRVIRAEVFQVRTAEFVQISRHMGKLRWWVQHAISCLMFYPSFLSVRC